jgi:hypothetical protein
MVYFPPGVWDNIKEFFFMKSILDRAADIALRCVIARSKLKNHFHAQYLPMLWHLDLRSQPFMMHRWIKCGCNMEWNYEELYNIRDDWNYNRYINIFSSRMMFIHAGSGREGLKTRQFRKLLKMNGVKGVSKMKKHDLVRAYLAL